MTIAIGTKLGRCEIRAHLGAGGMGEVYLAEDTKLDRKVAIKFLPSDSRADEQARKWLIREARAAAKLDHPNICCSMWKAKHSLPEFNVTQTESDVWLMTLE